MPKLKSFVLIILCLFFATCLKENQDKTITLKETAAKYIGKKGTLAISAGETYGFNDDISKTISYKAKITSGANSFDVDCGFYKASEKNLYAFCKIGTNIPAGKYSIDFSGIPKFNYQGYDIIFDTQSTLKFEFEKLDKDLIDLYSDKQTINIVEDKDSYELKFKIESYNQEVLIYGDESIYCKQENNELICQIKKNQIEKGLTGNKIIGSVSYLSDEPGYHGRSPLPLVGDIIITDYIAQKIDVFIGITKLIQNIAEGESNIAYETNITNIDNVISYINLDFISEVNGTYNRECVLRKYDSNPLLFTCFMKFDGKNYLKEIKEEKQFKDAHVKYNFRIQPVNNEEKIEFSKKGKGSWIIWLYPKILDFTKKDTLYVDYASEAENSLIGMTFNEDKGDLSCEIKPNRILRCTVTKSHFDGKKSGYYFTKHTNHKNGKSSFYESSPIKVILNDSPAPVPSQGNFYSNFLYYSLLLILIMY